MSTEQYEFDSHPKQELLGPIDQEDLRSFRLPTEQVERVVKDFQVLKLMGGVIEPAQVKEDGRNFTISARFYPDPDSAPDFSVPYDVSGKLPGKIAHLLGQDALTLVDVQTIASDPSKHNS